MSKQPKKIVINFISAFFTAFGGVSFTISFMPPYLEYEMAIVGLLSMILGELIDLPYRLKDKN